ncbi:MAG: peptidase T, partial [Clostridia bacterium]
MTIKDRFYNYAVIGTNSDESSSTTPSTAKQFLLCSVLLDECKNIGLSDVHTDGRGYIYAKLPSNSLEKLPKIGFIAHIDTSPDMSDINITPRIIKNYDGNDIVLNEKLSVTITVSEYPNLQNYIGDDLIVTDGTTLLGADDKAGIAEIMDFASRLVKSDKKHGDIMIAFTPDEEIGRGADLFDIIGFGADYAYTVDGGSLGEIEFENFNAASAKITISGSSIHPGTAKNKMINALQVAFELNALLPSFEKPEHTDNYEGFFHLTNLDGNVEKANMRYIIRDHSMQLFENKKHLMTAACDFINLKYGKNIISTEITDSYYNMREKILTHYYIIERLIKAMK